MRKRKSKCQKCKHFVKGKSLDDCPMKCWDCVRQVNGKWINRYFEPREV